MNFARLSIRPCEVDASSYVGFDYLVYALGSQLPDPVNIWSPSRSIVTGVCHPSFRITLKAHKEFQTPNDSQDYLLLDGKHDGTKEKSREWLRIAHHRIKAATSVLVVGGGALGVREYKRSPRCCEPSRRIYRVRNRYSRRLPK